MPKTYYIGVNKNGEPAIFLSKPQDSRIIGMAGTLDGAKTIKNDWLQAHSAFSRPERSK